jgi:hypothetical protein
MTFNTQAQHQGDEISGVKAIMTELKASHKQQSHQIEVNMAHMARNAGGSKSVPTTISTMTQAAPFSALAYAAIEYVAPPVHVPRLWQPPPPPRVVAEDTTQDLE